MAAAMQVDLPALAEASSLIGARAHDLDEILRRLVEILDVEGPCWGGDEVGVAFAAAYLPASAQTRAVFGDVRDGVWTVGRAIGAVVAQVAESDGRAERRFG